MTVSNKIVFQIDMLRNREHQPKMNKHDRGTALAFSGDLKHWTSILKNKPKF